MPRTEDVVFAFGALCEAGQAARLPQGADAVAAAGEELVGIRLVAHVPDQPVARRIEEIMERDGQFHDAQPRAQMTARHGDGVDQFCPQFIRKLRQLLGLELAQILGCADRIEEGKPVADRHLNAVLPLTRVPSLSAFELQDTQNFLKSGEQVSSAPDESDVSTRLHSVGSRGAVPVGWPLALRVMRSTFASARFRSWSQ